MGTEILQELYGGRLKVLAGDITAVEAGAIVNAANSSLLGGGGVDGAIHRAGGPAILEACREIRASAYPDGLPAGEAVITVGGKLPARYVIHTVGPVWHGGAQGEPALLEAAYRNCLRLAAEHHLSSLAFPAISTGVYGYPKEAAAEIVWRVVREHLEDKNPPEEILLVYFSREDARNILKVIEV